MAKIVKFDTEARTKMLKGVDTLANAVKVTLGPNVTFTAFARVSTPVNILVLASVSNFTIFAILFFSFRNSHNVRFFHYAIFFSINFYFSA